MNHGNCNAIMQMDDVAWLSLEECNNTPGLLPQSYLLLKIIIIANRKCHIRHFLLPEILDSKENLKFYQQKQ